MEMPKTCGIVGAGTMGAGIAQLAATAGMRTLLHDPDGAALTRGVESVEAGLERLRKKGMSEDAAEVRARLQPSTSLAGLGEAELVIEAAPEKLEIKRDVFGRLVEAVAADCVLATNTSSLSVTEIAVGFPAPERFVGLHFFNPAPVMRLVEVVPGLETSAEVLALARAVGEAMGKRVIDAADIPGFLVNRINRPFFLEALLALADRQATPEQIDRILRMAGGFRMGPFELMDLIGVDTNHAVAAAFYRQTYGEPRYRPSPLAAKLVTAGRLGRKSGRGWYSYDAESAGREPDPEPPGPGGGDGRPVRIDGDAPALEELRGRARSAGWDVGEHADPWLTIGSGTGPRAAFVGAASLHAVDPAAAGIHLLAPFDGATLVELTRTPLTEPRSAERLEEFVCTLGCVPEWVGDGPGLVLGRIVAQLVNEAAFLVDSGDAAVADVDAGLELGLNHPRGPIAWSKANGCDRVLAILDGLHAERGEERHRAAPLLRRSALLGAPLSDR